MEAWVWWAAGALGGAAAAAAPGAAVLGAAGVMLLAWRRGVKPAVIVVGALLFAAQAARGWWALERARAVHARSVAALTPPGVCSGLATVIESPIASVRAAEEGGEPGVYTRAAVSVHSGECEGRPLPEGLVARLYDLPDDVRRGDEIDFTAKLAATHLFEHAELPSPWPGIARTELVASGAALDVVVVERPLSLAGAIDAGRAHVRRRILATYAPDAAGLGRALVLGETDLAEDEIHAFRDSGLLHLLAVSGSHLVLVVAALAGALRRALLFVEPIAARVDVGRVAAAFGIGAAWLYADFAGGSGSAVRAAAMLTVALLAKALGHRPAAGRALAVALLVAALVEPLVALDVSFSLSAGATVGLVVLGKPLSDRLLSLARLSSKEAARRDDARGEPDPIAAHGGLLRRLRAVAAGLSRLVLVSVGTTLAATIGSLPAMLRFSPRLPVLGVLANVVAAPLGELMALPVCLAHATTSLVAPLERGLGLAGSGALLVVRAIAHAAAGAGGGVGVPPPSAAQLAAAAIGAAAIATARGRRRRLSGALVTAAALLLLEGAQRRAGAPGGLLRVTALDVGQGDALLVDFPDGRSMLVDGGGMVGNPVDPGTRVILPVLAARRRGRVDVLALTHPHPDHFTGLATVARSIPFGELWDTGHGEHHGVRGAYGALLAAARDKGAPVRRPADLCGRPRDFGGARVSVLWPCPALDPSLAANDASLVVRIDFGERSALLVGDAEHEAERALLASGAALRADLLKVGHHGSRTSSSADFLGAVSPAVAMISCGVRNRFGHPHPAALARLTAAGPTIARTDRGGAVVWETDGHDVWLRRP
jgi:competence protein ComEC